jgi:DNA-binding protein HU-beta
LEELTLIHQNYTTMANKADLVGKVQEVLGGTRADADRAVECMIDFVTSNLRNGEEVSIAGLGIFVSKPRAARVARNPRTGEMVNVPASRAPKFRPAKALKDAVK